MEKNKSWTARASWSRREFLSVGASGAVLLSSAAGEVRTEKVAEPADKVLLFGSVPQKYLQDRETPPDFERVARKLDIRVEIVPRGELKARYESLSDAERNEAAALSKRLVVEAGQQERPRPDDAAIQDAVRHFLAMRSLVAQRRAIAATIVCGSLGARRMPGPCAALTLLADSGVPTGCEGDIDAVLTMVLFQRVAGLVSFMGNASAQGNRLRVNHCVLPTRMKGPQSAQPYYLSDHHGSGSGVTIHTDLAPGEPVTAARLNSDPARLIVTQGTVVQSTDPGRGCRNALVIEVPDVRKVMSTVRRGQHHFVVACGHHLEKLRQLAVRAGIEVFSA
jgi:L-fucose isomerase-like protein